MSNDSFVPVSIRHLSKLYGTVKALDDVSLEIGAGEFMSLLGPSGSGKTTLLGMLGGFNRPTSGSIFFGERDVTLVPPHKRDIGVVFQNYALFPHMNVGDNVAFPLRARGMKGPAAQERVSRALATVELGGYEGRGIHQLSGGQRQRVALARAIVFEPRLILMDEPLSALDKQLRETMQLELRQMHKQLGATIIYVTHDQREALTMSDRIAVMRNGRLVQVDTPQRLHDHPIDDFVASFIGESTLLRVERAGGDAVRLSDAILRTTRPIPNEGEILLAIQSEKLILDDGALDQGWNHITGTVKDMMFQGESLKVFVTLADDRVISFRRARHHIGNQGLPQLGARVALGLHPADTIVVPRTA